MDTGGRGARLYLLWLSLSFDVCVVPVHRASLGALCRVVYQAVQALVSKACYTNAILERLVAAHLT